MSIKQEIPESWKIEKIGSLGKVITGKTPSTKIMEYWNKLDVPFITPGDIDENLFVRNFSRYVSEKGAQTGRILQRNTILTVCIGSTVGKVALASSRCITNQQINAVICNKNIDPFFLYYAILYRAKYLKQLAGVAAVPIVKKSLFENFRVFLPTSYREQIRLGEILSNIDIIIHQTQQLIDQLQLLKKGLMQRLFTEGIGHTVFQETRFGRIPKEWKILRFKDIAKKFLNGGTPPTSEANHWEGNIPWITSYSVKENVTFNGDKYINESGLKYTNVVPKGHLLLVSRTGIGKFSIAGNDIAISQDFTGVILDKAKVNPYYILWFLIQNSRRLTRLKQGSTIQGLIRRDIENFMVFIPNLEEQNEISKILGNIEDQIVCNEEIIKKYKEIKKSLMQQLLTGKRRVPIN